MKLIPLRRRDGSVRAFALVDDADYPVLAEHRWCWNPVNGRPWDGGYAVRGIEINGRRTLLRMHRVILGLEDGDPRQADHINRDKLDNRRSNLRALELGQNQQNLGTYRNGTSRFRGVYWAKEKGLWRVRPRFNGGFRHVGYFTDEVEAAHAAEAFRREHMPFAEPDPVLAHHVAEREQMREAA